MFNLIRSEGYKLSRNRSFWVLLAVLVLAAVAYCAMKYLDQPVDGSSKADLSGLERLAWAMAGNVFIVKIGLCVLAGFFISSEYASGTMKRTVSSGYSRSRIILAKSIVFSAGSVLIALAFPAASLILGSLLFGLGTVPDVSAAEYIVRCLGLTIALTAGHAAIVALFGTFFNDSGKTIGIGVIFFIFIDTAFGLVGDYLPFVDKIYEYSVFNQINHSYDPALTSGDIALSIAIPLATAAAFLALGVVAFRRKEIK